MASKLTTNLSIPKGKKAIVVGYVGGINVGDEAIVAVVANVLKEQYEFDVTIASGQVPLSQEYIGSAFSYIQAFYPGKGLDSRGHQALLNAIKDTDCVVFAGGGLLQDVHSTNLMRHCTYFATQAKRMGKHVLAFGLGAGPIKSAQGKALLQMFMDHNDRVFVRDTFSKQYIEDTLKVNVPHLHVGFDSILLVDRISKSGQVAAAETNKKWAGLCLREWKGFGLTQAKELTKALVNSGYQVLFMAYEKKDLALYAGLKAEFADDIALSDEQHFDSSLSTVANLDVLISMRLHANLFAILAGTRFVALAYDNKLKSVIGSLGFEERVLDLNADVAGVNVALATDFAQNNDKLALMQNTQRQHFAELLGCLNEQASKVSISKRYGARWFWALELSLKPRLRKAAMAVGPVAGKLIPNGIKKKVRQILGFDW
ncbi:polysaccharide pyruvyl transferase family protein [Aestuariibacter sp. AA17]|uniref:Polysaccharide pyruvyl transferase family protein n=1 Tax=Fluctibacter corallii TaxID=2984329 RepID=A0ABT3ABJ5_9ALTE|nr:polysaccharide pyruvyl transferase family protein [Aestuariibacter sp. AA17]MCV2886038.1 polysaccharide pyruvyl transferase family protein [Aestuariibacter sp. AA17]